MSGSPSIINRRQSSPLPLFPFNAVNFGCGLTGIRLRDYVLATAIGIVPGTFVYQFLFAKFGRKILTEGFRLEYLKDPQLWLALGLFAAFVIIGKWLSNKISRKTGAAKESVTLPNRNEPLREGQELCHHMS